MKANAEALSRNVLSARSKSDRRMASSLSALPPPPFNPAHAPVGTAEKVLVFSQWTGMLDLVEPALRSEGCAAGPTPMVQRQMLPVTG